MDNRILVLLGGPPGVGKSAVLDILEGLVPDCAVLDADDVWRVNSEVVVAENGHIAISNTISVMQGYFDAGCKIGVLSWVFAREELFGPVIEALRGRVDSIVQVYLTADEASLEQRLQSRGHPDRIDYSISRLRLIEELPYPKLDTTRLTPQEAAEWVRGQIRKELAL